MTPEQSGLVPSNYQDRKRESNKTNDSTFDRIYKYYHSSKTRIKLEEWEEEIRLRWEAAWFMLCRAKNSKEVADFIETKFLISKSLAYDDVRHAMNLFGDPRQDARSAKRNIAETIILRLLSRAEENGNFEMADRLLQKYIDINGLKDKGADAKLEDMLKRLKPQKILIVSDPEELLQKANEIQEQLIKEMEATKVKSASE